MLLSAPLPPRLPPPPPLISSQQTPMLPPRWPVILSIMLPVVLLPLARLLPTLPQPKLLQQLPQPASHLMLLSAKLPPRLQLSPPLLPPTRSSMVVTQ